jgi:hypothetical protein
MDTNTCFVANLLTTFFIISLLSVNTSNDMPKKNRRPRRKRIVITI